MSTPQTSKPRIQWWPTIRRPILYHAKPGALIGEEAALEGDGRSFAVGACERLP